MTEIDHTLLQLAFATVAGLFAFASGFLTGKYGLQSIVADVENLKNLKVQSPITVVPVVTPTPVG